MKKRFMAILCAVLVLGLAACGAKTPPIGSEPTSQSSTPPEASAPAAAQPTPIGAISPDNFALPLAEHIARLAPGELYSWFSTEAVESDAPSVNYATYSIAYSLGGMEGLLGTAFTSSDNGAITGLNALTSEITFRAYGVPEGVFTQATAYLEELGVSGWYTENDLPADGSLADGQDYYRYGTFTFEERDMHAQIQLTTKSDDSYYAHLGDDEWPIFSLTVGCDG